MTRAALLLAIALAALTGATPSAAAGPEDLERATLRQRGLELGYSLDHEEALAAFRQLIAADPTDASAHRLAAATLWMQALFAQGAITVEDYLGQAKPTIKRPAAPPAIASAFWQHCNTAISLGEAWVRARPRDAEAHFQLGAAAAVRASYIATVEGRVSDSVGAARRAFSSHKRVLALDPRRRDAGLIVGLYRYTTASLPFHMRLLARIAGFDSDREGGLRLVESAGSYGPAPTNAQLTLVLLYGREKRHADALSTIRVLQQRYPRNRLLWLEEAGAALRANQPGDALRALDIGEGKLASDPRPRATGELARWAAARAAAIQLRDAKPQG